MLMYLSISAQEETFSLVSSTGDTLLVVETNGKLLFNGEIYQKGVSVSAPIGTIQAWDKNLNGTPELKEGWVECNGQTISDENSPYNGKNVPNLNGLNSEKRFLRGNSNSGTVGGKDRVRWAMTEKDTSYRAWRTFDIGYYDSHGGIYTFDENGGAWRVGIDQGEPYYDGMPDDSTPEKLTYDSYTETNLPSYYEIVWIIKIK